MKKLLIALLCAVLSAFALCSCAESEKLVGYDIELAEAVCKFYDIKLENQLIVWETKETELNGGNIDCIWNGFTYSKERAENISFSYNYMINRQAMVIRKTDADNYKSFDNMKTARFVAEGGSAGETTIKSIIKTNIKGEVDFTSSNDQLAALTEVKSGTSDIAVIDNVMAGYYVKSANFSDLMLLIGDDFDFESEFYAIGFRKGGNTAAYVNYALYMLQENGTIATIAEKYGLTEAINTIPETANPGEYAADSDFGKIKAKGKLILGYTEFEPMSYYKTK